MSGFQTSEHLHRLKRPNLVRLDVVQRCNEANSEFYAANRRALRARIEKFQPLVECCQSPSDVLACMESLHAALERSNNCLKFIGDVNGDGNSDLEDTPLYEKDIDMRLIDADIQTYVLPALEHFFVCFAQRHSIEIKSGDDYRELWGGNSSGLRGLGVFCTWEGQQTFDWKRLFNSIFEEVGVPVDIDGGVLVHEPECRKRKARED